MYTPFTGRVCPPPIYTLLQDPLISQLYLLSIPFAESITTSYYFLLETSSFFYLIELLSFLCFDSKCFLPLCCLYYLFTNSIKQEFVESLKYTSNTFLQTVNSITREEQLTTFINEYLLLPEFSIDLFLTDPFYLIDWIISCDPSYQELLTPIKNIQVLQFYILLIKRFNNLDITSITFQYRLLKENVFRTHYNYVLGADISDAKI